MVGNILVVDDNPANVKVIEAYLTAAYFQVSIAGSGEDALRRIAENQPDLILLDVRMPGLSGFDVCRRLRLAHETLDIPIIMITAFDAEAVKPLALEVGADEFLGKPIDPAILLTRVRSMLRAKFFSDEIRRQEAQAVERGLVDRQAPRESRSCRILVVGDMGREGHSLNACLARFGALTQVAAITELASSFAAEECDLIVVTLESDHVRGMRAIAQVRALPAGRSVPILAVLNASSPRLAEAFEVGISDAIGLPLNQRELVARTRTLLRNKRRLDAIRDNLETNARLANIDELTGMHNRRFMETSLDSLIQAQDSDRSLSIIVLDIDHFKDVNDRFGHAFGDLILQEAAERVSQSVRGGDFCCRYGGEEFAVLMPQTNLSEVSRVAERLRDVMQALPFAIGKIRGGLKLTVSVGVAWSRSRQETRKALLYRADQALYSAKRQGRNRVIFDAA